MPRLSIIIPHRHNDQRLETTILSILENRPEDSEVIVVHDGSYTDPYELADEVIFVQEDARSNCVQLINAGMLAACSPLVSVVLDGVEVGPNWSETPARLLQGSGVAAVAVALEHAERQTTYGIEAEALSDAMALQAGRIDQKRGERGCAGPKLACGFYSRKVLLALGGWDERLHPSVADVDFAWALQELGLKAVCDLESTCAATTSEPLRAKHPVAKIQLAGLSVAYGLTSGPASALSGFLRGCLTGRLASAVAWGIGILTARQSPRVAERLRQAEEQLALAEQERSLRIYGSDSEQASISHRRAA